MFTRRKFLQGFTGASVIMLGRGTPLAWAASPNPNILMLAIDDLNNWVGYLGMHPQATTPNIDRLANQGTAFTHAYCQVPLCNPSRVSVMSGLYPTTTGIWFNRQDGQDVPHMVTHFQANGYYAAKAGKIFDKNTPINTWDEFLDSTGDIWPEPRTVPAIGVDLGNLDAGFSGRHDGKHRDFNNALAVADFLTRPRSEPFFLAYGTHLPHLPWYAPKHHFDQFRLSQIVLPQFLGNDRDDLQAIAKSTGDTQSHQDVLTFDVWEPLVQGYLAASHFSDECIGVVLDALEAGPYKDNTIVVLWSDHGFHLGEKSVWKKHTLWEVALQVPFIIKAAGAAGLGQLCHRPVGLIDLYPSLCGLTGVPTPIPSGRRQGRMASW